MLNSEKILYTRMTSMAWTEKHVPLSNYGEYKKKLQIPDSRLAVRLISYCLHAVFM